MAWEPVARGPLVWMDPAQALALSPGAGGQHGPDVAVAEANCPSFPLALSQAADPRKQLVDPQGSQADGDDEGPDTG